MARRALFAFALVVGIVADPGAFVHAAQACGNGACDAGETKQSCPQDCRPLLKLLRQRRGRSAGAHRPSASEAGTLGSGDSRGSLTVDGRARTYLLHQPAGYDSAKRYPLVLVFHGGGGAGAKIAKQTGFSTYADREGFLAVYPDGIEHNWNDGRGTTDAERLGVDDVAFVKTLLARLQQELSVDPQRVYATGPSNGGIFTYRLGCEMADVFAAIAPVIGNLAEPMAARCAPVEPLSVLAINGEADPAIPMAGGECCNLKYGRRGVLGDGGRLLSTEESLGRFITRNGCSAAPTTEQLPVIVQDGTVIRRVSYPGCMAQTSIVSYVIDGGGHAWPPRKPVLSSSGIASQNLDATQVIWEFFKQHSKPSPSPAESVRLGPGNHTREVPGWPKRPYDLHLPPHPSSLGLIPVVLAIHGGGGSSTAMARLTCPNGNVGDPGCLNALADREGFAVVYPNGTPNPQHPRGGGRRWNAGGGKNGYGCAGGFACEAGIDDLAYFRDLLKDVESVILIDRTRMYATGISNGGSMSHRLACELSGRIAAIAVVGGGNQFSTAAACAPARAVPVMQIHGTKDPLWPYDGGEGRAMGADGGVKLPVPETIRGWVERNGCVASPTVSQEPDRDPTDGTRARTEHYGACRDGAEVALYTVEGGGHTWPGGLQYLPARLIGTTSRDLNANEIVWDFFKRHALPAQKIES